MVVGHSFIQLNPIKCLQQHVYKYICWLKVRIEKYYCFLKLCNNTFVTVIATVVRMNICLPNYTARTFNLT